jgi:SAM-dependent methyltransferase
MLSFAYISYLRERPRPQRILHFAAERCFRTLFASHSSHYIVSEFATNTGNVRLDFDALGLKQESIDLIVANGALSCAPEHRRAVTELHRILKPDGSALICDPFSPTRPLTEWSAPCFGGRRAFGGQDLLDAFAPFRATLVPILNSIPVEDRRRFGLLGGDFALIRLDKK